MLWKFEALPALCFCFELLCAAHVLSCAFQAMFLYGLVVFFLPPLWSYSLLVPSLRHYFRELSRPPEVAWARSQAAENYLEAAKSGSMAVRNDSCALMLEESQDHQLVFTFVSLDLQHSFPDTRQISQVENIVKLCWCWQHFYLKTWTKNTFWS